MIRCQVDICSSAKSGRMKFKNILLSRLSRRQFSVVEMSVFEIFDSG